MTSFAITALYVLVIHLLRDRFVCMSVASSTLKGFQSFVRTNPMSDIISATRFHHLEFYCSDATTTSRRFMTALGLNLISKSDQSTGNYKYASYCLQSKNMTMVFTAPYPDVSLIPTVPPIAAVKQGPQASNSIPSKSSNTPIPSYNPSVAREFNLKHGLGVRAVAIEVEDVKSSYSAMIAKGAESVQPPTVVVDPLGGGPTELAEIRLYGDVVLRLVDSKLYKGAFLPRYHDVPVTRRPLPFTAEHTQSQEQQCNSDDSKSDSDITDYGFVRFDHVVGNLWSLEPTMSLIKNITGFHEFAEFVAEDVGTVDSGLNSAVLANNNEYVLLPLNEPTFGTPRKSQIQTYLEQNQGEGVQHIAMFTDDILRTLALMRAAGQWGGFDFMDSPGPAYYKSLRSRLGSSLSEPQYAALERFGVLADRDEADGVLLQIFTKPVGDRATLFLEVIQRIGCILPDGQQKAGCGGFGKGNFKDLFRSIEDYEKKLGV